jgi:flagellar basal-body rod modification protein FlgD
MPNVSSSTFQNRVQVPITNGQTAPAPATPGKSLGKSDFLKLLMAQLQHQDPLKPMDDTQMIAQMAQFSALEATQALNATLQQNNNVQTVFQSGALIGKYIQAVQTNGSITTGIVTGVNFATTNGVVSPTIQVNGIPVAVSTIRRVSDSPIPTA